MKSGLVHEYSLSIVLFISTCMGVPEWVFITQVPLTVIR